MRTLRIAAFVLIAAVAAIAQQADPPPADAAGPRGPIRKSAEKAPISWDYEAMIAAAMQHPEIRIAEAKLRQAEAELAQARLRAVQEVLTLRAEREAAEQRAAALGKQFVIARRAYESGQTSAGEKDAAEIQAIEARAELTKIELRARYLVGADGTEATKGPTAPEEAASDIGLSLPARDVQQALDNHVLTEDWSGNMLEVVLAGVQKTAGFVVVTDQQAANNSDFLKRIVPPDSFPKQMRLRAGLQALSDLLNGDPVFVVRDYGLLVTIRTIAESKGYAPTIPPLKAKGAR